MEWGGPWTSHKAGNTDCSLDWRGKGRESGKKGMEMGGGEKVEIFNKKKK